MNAGLLVDLPQLAESGAAGIGLFRTELQFMVAATLPARRGAGAALPRRARRGGRQAGDLPHPRHRRRQGAALFQASAKEENPAMGWRAIRLGLDRPGLLRTQIRALLKAAGGPRAAADAADGHRARRDHAGARGDRPRGAAPVAASHIDLPTLLEARRDGRGAVAAVAARRADAHASTSSRSAPTTCSSSSWRPTAATRGSRTASTRCRCRSCGRSGRSPSRRTGAGCR